MKALAEKTEAVEDLTKQLGEAQSKTEGLTKELEDAKAKLAAEVRLNMQVRKTLNIPSFKAHPGWKTTLSTMRSVYKHRRFSGFKVRP